MTLPATFWAKVDKTGGDCWMWIACVTSRGYGCFSLDGRRYQVHRLSWEDANGPIPDGLTIDHVAERCSSKLCVNPEHLEPVTALENLQRYYRGLTRCLRGHQLVKRPGDRQRRCRECENILRRARRAAERELVAA